MIPVEYLECIADLYQTKQVQHMKDFIHHPGVSCFEHCIFVSYVSYCIAKSFHLDYISCARIGLVHDCYLYPWDDKSQHPGLQCFDHPEFALQHASEIMSVTPKECNMILAHMWPLAKYLPKSAEAWLLSVIDKVCCIVETLQIWKHMRLRRELLS